MIKIAHSSWLMVHGSRIPPCVKAGRDLAPGLIWADKVQKSRPCGGSPKWRQNVKFKGRALKILLFLLLSAFSIQLPAVCHASFLDIGMGPRALGMGGAFTGLADDFMASYYNPAGLAQITNSQMGLSYALLFPGLDYPAERNDIGDGFLCYVRPFDEKVGAMGVSWINRHASTLYTENSYIFSYGRKLTERVSLGVNFKILELHYAESQWGYDPYYNWIEGMQDPLFSKGTSVLGISFDIGFFVAISRNWSVGICLKDFNQPDMNLQSPDPEYAVNNYVSSSSKIGVSYRAGEYSVSADLTSRRYDYFVNSGIEWRISGIPVAVRGGFGFGSRSYRQITAGASYVFTPWDNQSSYQLDYAFIYPFSGIDSAFGSHRMGLSIIFSPPLKTGAAALKFITPSTRMTLGGISSRIIIIAQDAQGKPDKNFNDTVVLYTTSRSAKFSEAEAPWSDVRSVAVTSGVGSFYFKDIRSGAPIITLYHAGLQIDTQQIFVDEVIQIMELKDEPRPVKSAVKDPERAKAEAKAAGAVIKETGDEISMTVQGDALFEAGSASLSAAAEDILGRITDVLKAYPKNKIIIECHNDAAGDQRTNLELSEKRADAAGAFFSGRGVGGDRMVTMGYGEDEPVASNNTNEGRAKNRRVVIILIK